MLSATEQIQTVLILVAASVMALAASAPVGAGGSEDPQDRKEDRLVADADRWDRMVEQLVEGYFRFNPQLAVYAGRHEYDAQFPDLSPDGVARQVAWWRTQRAQFEQFPPNRLDSRRQFERRVAIQECDKWLFYLDESGFLQHNPVFCSLWLYNVTDPSVYVTRPYASPEVRKAALARFLRGLPDALVQIRGELKLPLSRPHVETALGIYRGMVDYFEKDVPALFGDVGGSELSHEFEVARTTAVAALKEMVDWLAEQSETATDDFALGKERFLRLLEATEGVTITLDELKAAGQADLERNRRALAAACQAFAPGETIEACIARVQANKPAGGPVAGARQQLGALKTFLVEKQLVTIPGTEEALVEEAPPYARYNFAYIDIPGPYEKDLPSVYYIAPPDPSWSLAAQNDYLPGETDLLFTSVHEVWPGHFLQYLHANRNPSLVGRVFSSYAFSEGWAHYSEEMMWEAGLRDHDPEAHIGQLLNALLRNVRYVSAIGLHAEGMTVEQSRELFQRLAYQDEGNAIQQARRGTFDPGYLNYTLGKLMIRKLRADWTASRGGRDAWRQFHDTLLSYGTPPVPLVRDAMLGPDYQGDRRLLP